MRRRCALLLAAALVAGAAACGDDSGDRSGPGGAAAVASAEAYVAARGVDVKEGTQFVRSTRDPDWALVLGGGGRRTIWAV